MTPLLRRFRGLGIALAVLAISAGAVFAAGPSLQLSSHTSSQAGTRTAAEDPSESPEASESPEPSQSPEASETPEPSETAEPSESPQAPGTPGNPATPNPDTHGALVSTAAQMPTPSGFRNHGAFVSCVAHLHVSLTGFDWTTVTPAFCGITSGGATPQTQHPSTNGASHGAAGRAKGEAARAAHAPTTVGH